MCGLRPEVLELPGRGFQVGSEPAAEVVEDLLAIWRGGELCGQVRAHDHTIAESGHCRRHVDGLDHRRVVHDDALGPVQVPADHLPGIGVLAVRHLRVLEPGPGVRGRVLLGEIDLRPFPVDESLQRREQDLYVDRGVVGQEQRVEPLRPGEGG